jgi:hypothetical protein
VSSEVSSVLTFVSWYTQTAVYRGDDLIYYGEHPGGCWTLLKALGYTCRHGVLQDIPTHDIPREYSTDDRGWWKPHPSLLILKGQQDAFNERLRREEVAKLEHRLAYLRAEQRGEY